MKPSDPSTVLRERFGLEEFRGMQEPVIRALLEGRNALAVFPTGGGKSLCFQLPALLLDGITVVVSPLIALMTDQVDKLRALGIGAARLDSTLDEDEAGAVLDAMAGGTLRLLYVSPERFASGAFRKHLKAARVALVAVDEAHCISEWGHNFRPDYLKLAALCRRLRVPRVLALTATATPQVARDIRRAFRIATNAVWCQPVRRPNLRLTVCPADHGKDALLLERLRGIEGSVIVYVTTRRAAEEVTALLQREGFSARVYHAGCEPAERAAAQEAFMRGTTRIMVATIAFGMGIDKPDIRAVIHYHLPKCLEGYCQEIGRAGRDGLPARCDLLATFEDTLTLENFIHGSTPSPQGLKNLLDRVLRLAAPGKSFAVSVYDLSVAHDMREETVATVLAYLELAGIIERGGSYHDFYRVATVRPLEEILTGRAARESRLIKTVFAHAESDRWGLRLVLTDLTAATGVPRARLEELLKELATAGEIRITQRGLRVIYQTAKSWDGAVGPVIAELARRFAERARFEHGRIASVVEFVRSRRCRAVALADYFGQKGTTPCGECDRCLNEAPVKLPETQLPDLTRDEWAQMNALRDERHAALGTAAQLARFLCGIPSPAATKAKLNFRPEFGMWQERRFEVVRAMLGG